MQKGCSLASSGQVLNYHEALYNPSKPYITLQKPLPRALNMAA